MVLSCEKNGSKLVKGKSSHLGKPERKKPNHPDYVPLIFICKSDHEVSKSQNKLKQYQSPTKRSGECSNSANISNKRCCMSALRESTSSNIVDVKNLNVVDDTGASTAVICFHCLRN